MAETTEKILLAILGSTVLSTLVNGVFNYFSEKRKDKKGSGKLVMMLTASSLYERGEKFVSQGYADSEELKLFDDMYKEYKTLGGNGYADGLKERSDKLPIK